MPTAAGHAGGSSAMARQAVDIDRDKLPAIHSNRAPLGLIWVVAGVAGDRKRSLLISGLSVEIGSDRFRTVFRRAC